MPCIQAQFLGLNGKQKCQAAELDSWRKIQEVTGKTKTSRMCLFLPKISRDKKRHPVHEWLIYIIIYIYIYIYIYFRWTHLKNQNQMWMFIVVFQPSGSLTQKPPGHTWGPGLCWRTLVVLNNWPWRRRRTGARQRWTDGRKRFPR